MKEKMILDVEVLFSFQFEDYNYKVNKIIHSDNTTLYKVENMIFNNFDELLNWLSNLMEDWTLLKIQFQNQEIKERILMEKKSFLKRKYFAKKQ